MIGIFELIIVCTILIITSTWILGCCWFGKTSGFFGFVWSSTRNAIRCGYDFFRVIIVLVVGTLLIILLSDKITGLYETFYGPYVPYKK